ncbi:MAG TPA: MBL fold metallo-hydrolase [Dehalococcoidia bacterium]|nr:MBL fold metallo-hydrolase [Dehalococcoidia bacterium]
MQEEIVRDGRLLLVKIGLLGPVANNAYVIADSETNDAVVVDAPEGCEALAPSLRGLAVRQVIVTHRHRDHWAGIDTLLDMIEAPVLCHDADREPWEKYVSGTLADGDEVTVGGLTLRIVHTPGHTPGCICSTLAITCSPATRSSPAAPAGRAATKTCSWRFNRSSRASTRCLTGSTSTRGTARTRRSPSRRRSTPSSRRSHTTRR